MLCRSREQYRQLSERILLVRFQCAPSSHSSELLCLKPHSSASRPQLTFVLLCAIADWQRAADRGGAVVRALGGGRALVRALLPLAAEPPARRTRALPARALPARARQGEGEGARV